MRDALLDGAVQGLRAGSQRLLQAGKDIDVALQKALDFQSVFDRLKQRDDPVGAALDTLDREFTRLKKIFAEAGATTEEYAELERLYGIERAEAVKEAAERMVASFDYGVRSLTTGGTLTGGTPGTYRLGVSGGTPYRVPNIEMRVLSTGAVSAGQNGWTRPIDGGEYAAGSAAPTLTIPAGANLPSATVTATLGNVARPGERIGFEDGSRWTEQLVLTTPGLTVSNYPKGGKSRLPLFDCTDAIPTWTFDSGNVWSAVIGRAADYETVGGEDNYSLFQDTSPVDDMGSAYRWMTRVASKAACEATPDSYFIALNTFAETSATATVYVHAAGSVDPNTLKYRYNRRTQGVLGKDRLPNLTIDGISCIGPLSAQGSVNAGTNFLFRRAVLANAGKHDVVFESGVIEDVITWNTETVANRTIASTTPLDCIPFTAYRDDPRGLTATLRRCMSLNPSGQRTPGFFFSHSSGSDPLARYDETMLEAFASNNAGVVKGAQSFRQIYRALCLRDVLGVVVQPGRGGTHSGIYFENTHGLFTVDAAGPSAGGQILSGGANSTGVTYAHDEVEVKLRHNGVYNAHDQILGQTAISVCTSARQKIDVSHNTVYEKGRYNFVTATNLGTTGSAGIRYNIFVRDLANIGSFVPWVQLPASWATPIDWNVYVDLQANTNLRWRQGSTSYTFANWQALGFDTNSVVLNAAQADDLFLNGVAGLASGDFRLDPACTLKFGDGVTPLVGNAGIQEYYDWNARQYVVGQPKKFPTIPASWAECQAYAFDPTAWDFYA